MKSRLRPRYVCVATLALVAGALAFQLFVPPIIGLSDNGDFEREIGLFGYAPPLRVPSLNYRFVVPAYFPRHEGSRTPGYDQFTSDYLFVALAVGLSKILPGDGSVPITSIGTFHAVALVFALARLLFVTRRLPGYLLICVGSAVVLTDAGYVAYANSFFAEASSGIFAVWMIAEAVAACEYKKVGLAFAAASILLICAKAQNAPLALPLAMYALFLNRRNTIPKYATFVVLIAAGIFMFVSVKARPKLETSYNMLFGALLPESRDPRADLRALHLDPELVRLKGSLAWSPNSGLFDAQVRQAMLAAGPVQIAAFYLRRPTRLWRHITTLFPLATQLRPSYCGNFEESAGHAPGAITSQFSAWSAVHRFWLGRITKFLLFGLAAMMVTGGAFFGTRTLAPVLTVLPAVALIAFFTAAFGDANEPIKHQYLFNLMLDACLLAALELLLTGALLLVKVVVHHAPHVIPRFAIRRNTIIFIHRARPGIVGR